MSKKKQQMAASLVEEMDGFETGDIFDQISPPITNKAATQETQKPEKARLTVYLNLEQLEGLDQLLAKRRRKTGKSPRRSHLIEEAIELFLEQQP